MAKSSAATPEAYLAELPPERAAVVRAVRELVNVNLPDGYEEAMNWGMIAWQVPLETYPKTYNGQPLMVAAVGNQKNYISLYLVGVYGSPELRRLLDESGKKLKMGKGCINFNSMEELPLEAIAEIVRRLTLERRLEAERAADAARKR